MYFHIISYHIFHETILQTLFLQRLKKIFFLLFETLDFVLAILVITITVSAFPYLAIREDLRYYLQSFDKKVSNYLIKCKLTLL